MMLVIDNYDSFTYNLVQYLGDLGADPVVRRNDAIGVEEIGALAPRALLLSPGACAARPGRERRARPGSPCPWCGAGVRRSRSSACVSDIRRSARRTAGAS